MIKLLFSDEGRRAAEAVDFGRFRGAREPGLAGVRESLPPGGPVGNVTPETTLDCPGHQTRQNVGEVFDQETFAINPVNSSR